MHLHEGMLGAHPFYARKLSMHDLAALEALQQKVYDALPDKNTLQPLSTEEFENILGGNGLLIGIYVADELIAFRALLDPQHDPEHLGIDCGLTGAQLARVFYQEISNVDPDWRGYGLQKTMADIVMSAADLTRYDYVCATVKPYNIPSLKDKFAQGLVVKGLKLKYGGKMRYIFFKALKEQPATYTEERAVCMSDIDTQQALLKEGFVGTTLEKKNDDFWIIYKK